MFIATVFAIAKIWKQPTYPSKDRLAVSKEGVGGWTGSLRWIDANYYI